MFTLHQRPDGLWIILRDGVEVEGIAHEEKWITEKAAAILTAMAGQPPTSQPYFHLTARDGSEATLYPRATPADG